jgi:hypothetical protein
MAQHFDNLEEYGSAKFYYAQVIRNHPSTPLADQARERIAALGGESDRPATKLSWLINKLPESAERTAVAQVPLVDGASSTRLAEGTENGAPEQDDVPSGSTIRR